LAIFAAIAPAKIAWGSSEARKMYLQIYPKANQRPRQQKEEVSQDGWKSQENPKATRMGKWTYLACSSCPSPKPCSAAWFCVSSLVVHAALS
jgi:hypothetical protein